MLTVSVLAWSVLAWSGRRQVRWVASAASYGVINKARPNSPALSLLRLPRSRHAAASKDQRNLPAFTTFFCFTRAREAPSSGASRPTRRCADATDPIEPALRLLADVDAPDSFFAEFFFAITVGGQRWSSGGQRRW